jgi:hypothetical protein
VCLNKPIIVMSVVDGLVGCAATIVGLIMPIVMSIAGGLGMHTRLKVVMLLLRLFSTRPTM